jgi:hypothetical protein
VTGSDLLAWQGVIIFVLVLIAAAGFVPLFLRHRREVLGARATLARDDAYQRLAAQMSTEVGRLAGEIADLRRSMAEVERLMRAVD